MVVSCVLVYAVSGMLFLRFAPAYEFVCLPSLQGVTVGVLDTCLGPRGIVEQ